MGSIYNLCISVTSMYVSEAKDEGVSYHVMGEEDLGHFFGEDFCFLLPLNDAISCKLLMESSVN